MVDDLYPSMKNDILFYRKLGVHHAGLQKRYRMAVERLLRTKAIKVVIATATLALGINMPCKTVVFAGDSHYLNTMNYRQMSGRAGRRGFDLQGNVVFFGLRKMKLQRLVNARLTSLLGNIPMSVML